MNIKGPRITIRPFQRNDADSIARYANNFKIWLNLRDAFPHPYSTENALDFIRLASEKRPVCDFALEFAGEAVGAIGFIPQNEIYHKSFEIGYWLGEPFWEQGLVTEAVRIFCAYIFENQPEIVRLYARVFSHNPGSMRVLEKAGFQKEGILRQAIFKNGELRDEHCYALLRSDWTGSSTAT